MFRDFYGYWGQQHMRGVRILTACLAAALALSGFMAATASAEVQEEPATQEAATAEVAEEAAEVAEEAAEEAGEAGAANRAMAAKRKRHPGYEYQLHHLTFEIRRLRRRKAEIRTHPATEKRAAALLRQKEEIAKDVSRRHEVRIELKEKELKEKEKA